MGQSNLASTEKGVGRQTSLNFNAVMFDSDRKNRIVLACYLPPFLDPDLRSLQELEDEFERQSGPPRYGLLGSAYETKRSNIHGERRRAPNTLIFRLSTTLPRS